MVFDYASHTVLVTGASSGIGVELATGLAKRGASLILVARRKGRLDALAAELRKDHNAAVHTIAQDLTSPTADSDLRSAVDSLGVKVTGLINNAGFGTFGLFIDEDRSRLAEEIAVDISIPVKLSHEFLPDIIANGRGFLINVASMAAYTPAPRMAVYAAAKAFILNFTESLWAELRGSGVTAFALSPGATSTEFNTVVGTDDATAGARPRTPSDVAATAFAHLDKRNPGPSVIDGASNRFAASALKLVGRRATVNMMHRLTDPSRRRDSAAPKI